MKVLEVASILANRVNQKHYIIHYMNKVYEEGYKRGIAFEKKDTPTCEHPFYCVINNDGKYECLKCNQILKITI